MNQAPRNAGPAGHVVEMRVELWRLHDGTFVADLETPHSEDGHHWSCCSDPKPTRAAALQQCLKIARRNQQLR